ncbi:MAG: prepilin peptidase [Candidatus Pacebacteria bacterium]|nr:prepilin peptidase [Candidatus Paceibacterota bacterium]
MFYLFFSVVIFLFGLIIGSFLNCVIDRLETKDSFLKGRSFCPNCRHVLSWQDLIPVFSFLFLRGKCRYCRKAISWQYPLMELATGALFVLVFRYFAGDLPYTIYGLIIASFLIIIFVYDLKHYVIPDSVIYPAIAIALLYQLFQIWSSGYWNLAGFWNLLLGILPTLFFLAIILISRGRWMGFGDFELAILMGLILGWPNILIALFSAFFIGALVGTWLIVRGAKTLKSEVPFGPFLVTGTFLALFLGDKILDWYLTLFLLQ